MLKARPEDGTLRLLQSGPAAKTDDIPVFLPCVQLPGIDVDGNAEQRKGTISVFDGPVPSIQVLATADAEIKAVSQWLVGLTKDGMDLLRCANCAAGLRPSGERGIRSG